MKIIFLLLPCSNVLLHLKYRVLLCEPEIKFKNLRGGKALATDHRALNNTSSNYGAPGQFEIHVKYNYDKI